MAVDLATLAIKIESVEAQLAQQRLDWLAQSGAKAEQAIQSLGSSSTSAGSALQAVNGHVLNFAGQLMALVGISLSVGAALSTVKSAIDAISQSNLNAIAGAAMMVSRSGIEGVQEQQAAYEQYKEYMLGMYRELNKETTNHFASGKEMINTQNALVQLGIYGTKEEAKDIGVITDAAKLLKNQYIDQASIQHEIMGILQGHEGMHFRLAQQLATLIGPNWKQIIRTQVESGNLLKFLGEQYKGLSIAQGDIQKNLDSQKTTLSTITSQIKKSAFAGLYQDVVNWLKLANQYLDEHRTKISAGISVAWDSIKSSIGPYIQLLGSAASSTMQWAVANSELLKTLLELYIIAKISQMVIEAGLAVKAWAAASVIFTGITQGLIPIITGAQLATTAYTSGMYNAATGTMTWSATAYSATAAGQALNAMMLTLLPNILAVAAALAVYGAYKTFKGETGYTSPENAMWEAAQPGASGEEVQARAGGAKPDLVGPPEPDALTIKIREMEEKFNRQIVQPPVSKPALGAEKGKSGGGGGGGAKDMGLDRMQGIIDGLQRDLSRLTEGSLAEIEAWSAKTINEIEKVGRKGAETETALALVAQVEAAKKKKATEDYEIFIAKESGNAYVAIEAEARSWLEKYKGFADAEANIVTIKNRKIWEEQVKQWSDYRNLQKNSIDAIAAATPDLAQQNTLRAKSLEIEIELGRYELERRLNTLQITEDQKNELRGLQTLADQAKRYNQEMESNRGFQGWAFQRVKSESQRNTAADFMEGAESFITDAFSQGIQGALSKTQFDFMQTAKTMATSFVLSLGKQGIHSIFNQIAEGILGKGAITGKPDGSMARPLWVRMAGSMPGAGQTGRGAGQTGLPGIKGLGAAGGFSIEDAMSQYGQDNAVLQGIIDEWSGFLGEDLNALGANVEGYGGMFTGAIAGLTQNAGEFGSVFGSFINAISGLLSGGGEGGGFGGIFGSIISGIAGIFGFHEGGVIKAHSGWPRLAADEVPIIAQTGERVLSRRQNRDYEAGLRAGGGGSAAPVVVNITHAPVYHHRATQNDHNRDAKMLVKALNKELGRHGRGI